VRLCGTHNKFTLSQPGPDLVRLRPGPVIRGLGWAFCLLGWPVLLLGLISIVSLLVRQTFRDAGAVLFLLLWGFPFAFLGVALLAATELPPTTRAGGGHVPARSARGKSDPTRHWPKTDEPLPPFDLAAGALGGLRLGDDLRQAEFLGRPDRVENPGWTRLHY